MARKRLKGTVVSSSMDSSIVVKIEYKKQDGRFHKTVNRSKKFIVHDEKNEANVGDVVVIEECRPISKRKNYAMLEVVEKAKV